MHAISDLEKPFFYLLAFILILTTASISLANSILTLSYFGSAKVVSSTLGIIAASLSVVFCIYVLSSDPREVGCSQCSLCSTNFNSKSRRTFSHSKSPSQVSCCFLNHEQILDLRRLTLLHFCLRLLVLIAASLRLANSIYSFARPNESRFAESVLSIRICVLIGSSLFFTATVTNVLIAPLLHLLHAPRRLKGFTGLLILLLASGGAALFFTSALIVVDVVPAAAPGAIIAIAVLDLIAGSLVLLALLSLWVMAIQVAIAIVSGSPPSWLARD